MTKIIAIANQKGGVGKTTTSINIAASLAATGRRVLLVDIDPQGNATMGSGINKMTLQTSSFDVLMGEKTFAETFVRSENGQYDLLPANGDLTGAEVGLLDELARESRLRRALAETGDNYHFVFIDCPPSLNMLTVNALVAATSVIIPIQCEYYALEGLSALLESVEKIRKYLNANLEIEGLLRTMYDPRNNLALQVSDELIEHFGERVYRTIIPRNVNLAEAPSYGLPIIKYNKNSRGALAYLALAGEMLRRERAVA